MTENFITLEEAEEEISMDNFWEFDFGYLKNNSDGLVWNNTETGSRIKVCTEKGILTGKAVYGYLQITEKFLY